MKHLEIEMKTLLNEEDYLNLKAYFSDVLPVTQKNYYLDSTDFLLRKHRIAMRIRTFEDSAELTIKIPQAVGNMEYNQALSLKEAIECMDKRILPDGLIVQELARHGITTFDWKVLGCLTTIRYEKETPIGLMALDQSHYFDVIDFELELEVENHEQGVRDFQDFLKQHHIEYQKAPSKLARFTETMAKY